jgi:hypothetical protein
MKIHRLIIGIAFAALLCACGGGGGGVSSTAASADFTGTWSGMYGTTPLTYQVGQSGNVLSITRTAPADAAITYTGTVNGDSAVVTTFVNGISLGTTTFTKTSSTSISAVVNSCIPSGGYTCVPPGTTIVLTKTTLSYPMQSGYRALVASGLTKSFTISGTCSGSGNKSSSPATTPATFEGTAGFSATSTLTLTYSNCTPATTAVTATAYFDTNYDPLGVNSVGVNYGVYLTPLVIPTSVTVGGTGTLGTLTLYTSSTKATPNGRIDLSYVVEADTSTTAIVNLIAKSYNAAGTLIATEQDRYRITSTGALTPTSIDIQAANGSTTHLVFTF